MWKKEKKKKPADKNKISANCCFQIEEKKKKEKKKKISIEKGRELGQLYCAHHTQSSPKNEQNEVAK